MLIPVAQKVLLQQRATAEHYHVSGYIEMKSRLSISTLTITGNLSTPDSDENQHPLERRMICCCQQYVQYSVIRLCTRGEYSPAYQSASAGATQANSTMFAPIMDYRPLLSTELLAAKHAFPRAVVEPTEWQRVCCGIILSTG
jgi:hypothetical protein